MKIALITDTHFGARGDSPAFNEYFFKFWENIFFPYIEKHGITTVVHLGDVVDRRRFINFVTLSNLRRRFISRLKAMNVELHVIVGNHDVPYRNTNDINAIAELFSAHDNIKIYSNPEEVLFDKTLVAFIPWINNTNLPDTIKFIEKCKSTVCFGHFELAGFEMDRGVVCQDGLDKRIFNKFDMTLTGHFHHPSTDGFITYLGNTYEMTWADYADARGFHILDTDTLDLEFIQNPYHMFHKIVYDDSSETLDSITNKNYEQYTGVIVKVVVASKANPVLYDLFLDNLYKALPLEVSIVEDFTEYREVSDEDILDQSDDTSTILNKYIDNLEIDLDKEKLKSYMKDIYNQAHNLEST